LDKVPGTLTTSHRDLFGQNVLAPATMHGSAPGDPMWLVEGGDGATIGVIQMSNVLGTPSFQELRVPVDPYTQPPSVVSQPNGSPLHVAVQDSETGNRALVYNAEYRAGHLVVSQTVGLASDSQAHARWYDLVLPVVLTQQGKVYGVALLRQGIINAPMR
jgi:hypothetical protein